MPTPSPRKRTVPQQERIAAQRHDLEQLKRLKQTLPTTDPCRVQTSSTITVSSGGHVTLQTPSTDVAQVLTTRLPVSIKYT